MSLFIVIGYFLLIGVDVLNSDNILLPVGILSSIYLTAIILSEIGKNLYYKEFDVFKNSIKRYDIFFLPHYKDSSFRYNDFNDKERLGKCVDYSELGFSSELIKKIRKIEKHDKEIIDLCVGTDDYAKINYKIKKIKEEYDLLLDLIEEELPYNYRLIESGLTPYRYYIGYFIKDYQDQFCGQGQLKIQKDINTNKFYVYCDECGGLWDNPHDAINCRNGIDEKNYEYLVDVTYEELKKVGWDKYVDEKRKPNKKR